jgi:hypothetical protein
VPNSIAHILLLLPQAPAATSARLAQHTRGTMPAETTLDNVSTRSSHLPLASLHTTPFYPPSSYQDHAMHKGVLPCTAAHVLLASPVQAK